MLAAFISNVYFGSDYIARRFLIEVRSAPPTYLSIVFPFVLLPPVLMDIIMV